ncbi:unnamed protein product [Spodoptera littoralis]|uniref:Uncharacterized protein n=1 Tax=Spodoptera littoralis TaxID=7109 RepID=A0A9P0N4N2_SPOLI|nr:unnamed protein product [Spodoptera littoralis]CAH1644702.1 unnamed protein product [Spodoptera littoralis]
MGYRIITFVLVVFLFGTSTVANHRKCGCLKAYQIAACNAVFSPRAMEVNCCHPMKILVDANNQCLGELDTDKFTCAVSKCATEKFKIRSGDHIDLEKVKSVSQRIGDNDPETLPPIEEIKKNCLDDRYLRFVTTDSCCDTMKFQVCAYVSALMGCQKFYTHPHRCRRLAINVAICKPVLQDYLDYINGSSSC